MQSKHPLSQHEDISFHPVVFYLGGDTNLLPGINPAPSVTPQGSDLSIPPLLSLFGKQNVKVLILDSALVEKSQFSVML